MEVYDKENKIISDLHGMSIYIISRLGLDNLADMADSIGGVHWEVVVSYFEVTRVTKKLVIKILYFTLIFYGKNRKK